MVCCAARFLAYTLYIGNALNESTLRAEFPLWTSDGSFRRCCWNGLVSQYSAGGSVLFTYFHADVNLLVGRPFARPAGLDSD